MAATTATTLAGLIQSRIREATLALNEEQFLFWPGQPAHGYVQVDDRTDAQGGSTEFGQYNKLVAYKATDGIDHTTTQTFSPDFETVATDEHVTVVAVTDKALRRIQDPNGWSNWAQKTARAILRAHMTAVDTDVFEEFASLQEGVADSGNALTYSDLFTVVGKLRENDVPPPWIGFLSPQQWSDLVSEANTPFIDAAQSGMPVGGEVWQHYTVQRFLGVTWIVNSRVYSDGTDDYGGVISGNPEASPVGIVVEKLPFPLGQERDESHRLTELVGVSDFGAGIIDGHTGDADATGYHIKTRTSA